jgi:Na+/proline symporter
MISGKKLMKVGWYLLALPLILLFLSIIVSMIVSGSENAVNPVTSLIGALLALCWALAVFPLVIGFIVYLFQKSRGKQDDS